MKIIIKYLFRNIFEKKFRTLIAILSIAISAALFFASVSVSDSVVKMFTDNMKSYTGSADLVIRPKSDAPQPFFAVQTIADSTDVKNQVGAIEGVAQYQDKQGNNNLLKTLAISLDELQRINPFQYDKQQNVEPFTGKKLIISSKTADKFGLKVGDSITMVINGKKETFSISGVATQSGIFREFGTDMYAVLPLSIAQDILGQQSDQVNLTLVQLKTPENSHQAIGRLQKDYKDELVQEAVSVADIQEQVGGYADIFLVLTLIISLFSIFIIYSSFKVITVERINVMGVFRSIGATKRMTGFVLMGESLIYGILGGLLGCGIGIGLLFVMSNTANQTMVKGATVDLVFTPSKLVFTLLIAIVLCVISSFIPVRKASGIPLKDIIVGKIENYKASEMTVWSVILRVLPLVLAVILPCVASSTLVLPFDLISLILLVMGLIWFVPVGLPGFHKLFGKLYGGVLGSEGFLAVKNIKENKNIMNNISLLAVVVAILLMINTIINGIMIDLTSFYTKTVGFDVSVTATKLDSASVKTIENEPGVKDAYGSYTSSGIELVGQNQEIGMIEGADPSKYADYWHIDMSGKEQGLLSQLNQGRNIILENSYKNKLHINVGDTITLKMKTGNQKYTVIGFMSTRINNSHYALISSDNLKQDMELGQYSVIYVKTDGNVNSVVNSTRVNLKGVSPIVNSMKQVAQNDLDNNSKLFVILRLFLLLAVLVGVMSVMNNLVINFLERKRVLAMMRSVGMSKQQIIKMILIEALTSGIIGGVLGVLGGIWMVNIMPQIVDAVNQHIALHYSVSVMVVTFVSGVLVTMLASLSTAFKSSKINIVESIRMD